MNEPQARINALARRMVSHGATARRLQDLAAALDNLADYLAECLADEVRADRAAAAAALADIDPRPDNCRERLREEGLPFPSSRCFGCGMSERNPKNCPH